MVSLSLITVISTVLFLNKRNSKCYHYISYLLIFSCSLVGLHWIYNSLFVIGGLPFLLSVFSTGLLAFYVAAFYIVALALSRLYAFSSLEIAAIITTLELLRSLLFSGFPWLEIGVLGVNLPLAKFAPFLGSYGVTFLIVLCIATLVNNFNFRSVLKVSSLVLISLFVGLINLTAETKDPIKILLVQGGIPQLIKFDPEHELKIQKQYYSLIKTAISNEDKIEAIVLPETALIRPLELTDKKFLERLSSLIATSESKLITGIPYVKNEKWYNSLLLLKPNLKNPFFFEIAGEYHKHHLVPFGEFIPTGFKWFIGQMKIPLGDFARGKNIQSPITLGEHKIVSNICFEDLFNSEIIEHLKQPGLENESTILLNISNLGWFGESNSLKYHLMAARMRSIETSKPTVRSTNTGMTAHIDHKGRVKTLLHPTKPAYVVTEITGRAGQTPFTNYGNTPILLLCIFVLIAGAVRRIFR
ncbi:apolipoprotein N-acyltransferase [Betaproteobacteria bacterium]|nr:apolipoprotein N-acyltransferase [Betaproteobacteria bacterium]